MFYDSIALLLIILGLGLCYFALRFLFRNSWILGFLRGLLGLFLLSGAIILALAALDLFSYRQLLAEESVATLSFERLAPQRFTAILVNAAGEEQRLELAGDQWQLDARVLKWTGPLAAMGMRPGYRLDRLSGRYYSLEQERNAERTVYDLNRTETGLDVWHWLDRWGGIPGLDAVYGSATFVPMADGALYEVAMTNSGLIARPLNERARSAVSQWQ